MNTQIRAVLTAAAPAGEDSRRFTTAEGGNE